ncbi:MAG: tail fiber domain-containing protein [Vicingaceae bacterium]
MKRLKKYLLDKGLKMKEERNPSSLIFHLSCLKLILLFAFCFLLSAVEAQNISINADGSTPHPSAMLDVSDTTKGFLPPRLNTSQMNNIAAPANGLFIYNTDSLGYFFYNGSNWVGFGESSSVAYDTLNENVFAAKINNPVIGPPAVGQIYFEIIENYDFIDYAEWNSSGVATVFFNSGFFTEPPAIVASIIRSGVDDYSITVGTVTTSSAILYMRNGASTGSVQPFYLTATRQGTDYRYNTNQTSNQGPVTVSQIPSSVSDSSRITDADGDTKIQVEESADEDIIRFDNDTRETFTFQRGRIAVLNAGNSIAIGDGAGASDDFSNRHNIFLGSNAGNSVSTGFRNVALGGNALSSASASTVNNSIAIGFEALKNSTGFRNVAIGSNAMEGSLTSVDNVAVGYEAALSNSASSNTAIGARALSLNSSGQNNVAIGTDAGNNNGGVRNIFLGYQAGMNETGNDNLYIENSNSTTPLIYGDFANDSLKVYGTLSVDSAKDGSGYTFPGADGTTNQYLQTDGSGNVSWANTTTDTLDRIVANSSSYALVKNGGFDIWLNTQPFYQFSQDRIGIHFNDRNVALGERARSMQTGTDNTSVGYVALEGGTGGGNVAVGAFALSLGNSNSVGLGYGAGRNNTGSGNVFLGYQAGLNETGSNKLYIENSNSSTPLIYGDFANDSLKVYGTLSVDSAKDGSGYTFPGADGNPLDVLQTDGSGNLSWASAAADGNGIYDGNGSLSSNTTISAGVNSLSIISSSAEAFKVDNGTFTVNASNNRVGIGTTSPASSLEVNGDAIFSNATNGIRITNNVAFFNGQLQLLYDTDVLGSGEPSGSMIFRPRNNANTGMTSMGELTFKKNLNESTSYLSLSTRASSGLNEAIRIDSAQRMGIGTSTPDSLLDVAGGATINRLNINSRYTFPDDDGNPLDVLQTDGSGNVSWAAASGGGGVFEKLGNTIRDTTSNFNSDFVIGSPTLDYSTEAHRMFFDKSKAAFRAGFAASDSWDSDSLGNYSAAFGHNTTASGNYSFAAGRQADARGSQAIAFGYLTVAQNDYDVALGFAATAEGARSFAAGSNASAEGFRSAALGYFATAEGEASVSMGTFSTAAAENSIALGQNAEAQSYAEISLGSYPSTYTPNSTTAWDAGDRLLSVGNGTGSGARSDALTILKDGKVGIGTATPTENLEVNGRLKTNGIQELSDARYKTNVETLTNALDKLTQLRGVSYDWDTTNFPEKNFNARKQIGLIAQELEPIFPELVHTDQAGYKSVDYSKLVAVLVEAVKEQNRRLSGVEGKVVDLEAKLDQANDENQAQSQRIKEIESRLSGVESQNQRLNQLERWMESMNPIKQANADE